MGFFTELKRRNVFRVGIAYLIGAWVLLQVADVIVPIMAVPDWVPRLILLLLAIGLPIALVFAWAFEITPEGIKKESEVDRSQSIAPATGKRLDRIIIGGLIVLVLVLLTERFWFAGRDTGPVVTAEQDVGQNPPPLNDQPKSVAVLPFTAMSSGEDDGYFADGLTEEILNSLSRLPELLVTARTSSFHFKDKDIPIPEVAHTLGVDHVVEGSVRRSGAQLRITAQLIRAKDGFHLWSNTYDRSLEDIFSVQEDIAENIAAALDVVLNEDKRQKMRDAGIGNVDAYIAYQKAMEAFSRAHTTMDSVPILREAKDLFDQVLEIIPDFPEIQYLYTDMYGHVLLEYASGYRPETPRDELEFALNEVRSGLDKAWQYARQEGPRGKIDVERTMFSDDWSNFADKLDLAFAVGDCTTLNWMQFMVGPYGWAQKAADHLHYQVRCDPMNSFSHFSAQFSQIWAGDAEAAGRAAKSTLKQLGFHPWIDDNLMLAALASGRGRDEPRVFAENPTGSLYSIPRKVLAYAQEGDAQTAVIIMQEWQSEHAVDDADMLVGYAITGQREMANEIAGKIDQRFQGNLGLSHTIWLCMCGAPFDIEATPNFQARIEESGFDWPPVSPINYPLKDW